MATIVDVHAHVFSDAVVRGRAQFASRDPWFGRLNPHGSRRLALAPRLVAAMDAAGVAQAVALSFGWADHGICVEQNDLTLAASGAYPHRLLPFCAVQPAAGRAAVAELERMARLGARGVGELYPDGQGFAVDDPHVMGPVLEACAALNLVVLIHASEPLGREYPGKGRTTPDRLMGLAALVKTVAPDLPVILAHLGGGLPFYELLPEVQALAGTLYYDTGAAAYLYRPEALAHVATLAPGRLLFGSDYPVIGMKRMVDFAAAAGLAPDAYAEVMGGAAARLFDLR